MDLDPKACAAQILCVLGIWLLAYGAASLIGGKDQAPFSITISQLDGRTSALLDAMER